MFASQKRIFAGKQSLRSQPFCPYLSTETGYISLFKSFGLSNHRPSGACQPRPSVNGGKSRT